MTTEPDDRETPWSEDFEEIEHRMANFLDLGLHLPEPNFIPDIEEFLRKERR